MRNRAKCKLCQSIIESYHEHDYVDCKCGEISIHGGLSKLGCAAKDFKNFMRVDDLNNEIIVTLKEKGADEKEDDSTKDKSIDKASTREEKLKLLDEMIANIEKIPQNGMLSPINHYDFCSALLLLSSIFRSED